MSVSCSTCDACSESWLASAESSCACFCCRLRSSSPVLRLWPWTRCSRLRSFIWEASRSS
eukprot:5440593-Prymnesium_polylepis.2